MKHVAFIHDHEFIFDGKNAYSPGKLSESSFDRYLELFDKVTIISRFRESTQLDELTDLNKVTNERIEFSGFENQSKFANRFIFRNKFRKKLKNKIENFDALIIRVPSEIGFLASEIAFDLGTPYVCEVVACPADAMDGFNSLKSRLYKHIIVSEMQRAVMQSDGVLYVTSHFLQNRYPTKGFTTVASNVEISEVTSSRFFTPKDTYIITLTGNLDSFHKGYDILYAALEVLEQKLPFKIVLNLVGKGTAFKRDFNYKNITLFYPGVLSRVELFNLLDSSDLYIQPSNQEGLPRATIEAMSRGLPCVVSDAGGLPELVDKQFVHSKLSHEELAKNILNTLSSKLNYELASANNTERAQQYLTSKLSEQRRKFYSKLRELC